MYGYISIYLVNYKFIEFNNYYESNILATYKTNNKGIISSFLSGVLSNINQKRIDTPIQMVFMSPCYLFVLTIGMNLLVYNTFKNDK